MEHIGIIDFCQIFEFFIFNMQHWGIEYRQEHPGVCPEVAL